MPKSPLEIIRKAEELQNPDVLAEVVLDIEEDVEEMEVKIQEIKDIAETTKKEKGEKGDSGLKGDKGDKGERGEKGEKGDKGEKGLDGKNGINGKDGIDGLNGIDGIKGKDGSPDTGGQIVDKINYQSKKIEYSKLDLSKVEKDIKELKEKPAIINNIVEGQGGASGIRDVRAGTGISVTKVNEIITVTNTQPAPDLSGYVPYTGATSDVNLGEHNLSLEGYVVISESLSIGTTSPRNTNLDIVAPAVTLVTGSGTITPSQILDDGIVTGTGTAFLSQVKVGDLISNTAGNLASMVTRVVSDTQLWYVGQALGFMGAGSSYRIVKRIASTEDSNGNTSWAEASPTAYNEQTGVMDYDGRVFGGGYTMFANRFIPNSGIIVKQQSNDGQMRIKHIQSGAYLNFQASGANITANGLTIVGNSTWASPLYLGMDNYAGGQTGIYIDRTGTGTGQTMYLTTRIYATNGASPLLQVSANGLDFGRRDGSTWNEAIDDITLSMDKTSGKWSIGSLGTTTPTGATTRLDFATVGETFGLKTGTNATIGSATMSGGTITINTTAVTANSMIVLSPARTSIANLGIHYESARTAGTSFTITSTNASDDSTFDWHLVEKL